MSTLRQMCIGATMVGLVIPLSYADETAANEGVGELSARVARLTATVTELQKTVQSQQRMTAALNKKTGEVALPLCGPKGTGRGEQPCRATTSTQVVAQ